MSGTIPMEEVAKHKKPENLWIVVKGNVYNVTEFQNNHPGGQAKLWEVAGTDATKDFNRYHDSWVLDRISTKKLMVGVLDMPANTATPQKESFFAKLLSWRKKKTVVGVAEQVKVAETVVVKETNQDQAVVRRIEKHVEVTDRLVVPPVQQPEGMVAEVEDVGEDSAEKE